MCVCIYTFTRIQIELKYEIQTNPCLWLFFFFAAFPETEINLCVALEAFDNARHHIGVLTKSFALPPFDVLFIYLTFD